MQVWLRTSEILRAYISTKTPGRFRFSGLGAANGRWTGRPKQVGSRDPQKTLDNFDFTFNPKKNRTLVFHQAMGTFIA